MVEHLVAPWPLITIVIEPKSKADLVKLRSALLMLAAEDSSFSSNTDAETGQIILGGFSELHLDEMVGILQRTCTIHVGAPQVAFRETVTRPIDVDYTHKRLAHGVNQFARVKLRVEPNADCSGFVFLSNASEGGLPAEFASAVRQGVASAMQAGVVAGFPVVDVKVAVLDAAFHESDSSALAFETAARGAFREALVKGGSTLLEPIMAIEVLTPPEYVDAVVADLRSRHGQIEGQEIVGDVAVISALTSLMNLFGYVNTLRSATRGHGTCRQRYSHYAPVSQQLPPDAPVAPAVAMRP